MKLDCGKTGHERAVELENWHLWFAWHPVRIGAHDCRWLEFVERKGDFDPMRLVDFCSGWHWSYRLWREVGEDGGIGND